MFLDTFKGVSRELQSYLKKSLRGVSREFQGCSKKVFRVFQWSWASGVFKRSSMSV